MKKYCLLITLLGYYLTNAQIVTITNNNLKQALLNHNPVIDINSDGEIQVSEALNTTALTITYGPIGTNYTGLEAFVNLTSLQMNNVSLFSIDLSSFTSLQHFACKDNHLTSLNLAGLTNLQTLDCTNNDITSINVSGLNNLTSLTFTDNFPLTSFIHSGLPNLTTLKLDKCSLPSLNLNGLGNLNYLDCNTNSIASLDLSQVSSLTYLNCSKNALSSLNLTNLNNLTHLECGNNQYTTLNLSNLVNLTYLDCDNSYFINSLIVNNLINLTYLSCSNCNLSNLQVDNLVNLATLDCSDNQLTTLNVAPLIQLTELDCRQNELSSIDVSSLVNLNILYCGTNNLTQLDISTLVNLHTLHCNNNSLTNLDVSNNNNIVGLACGNNSFTSLDVSNLTQMSTFTCSNNPITTLNISNCINLAIVWIENTLLTNLDFSNLTLEDIVSSSNISLFLDNNPNLTYINLKHGLEPFTYHNLKVASCPNLAYICANESQLTALYQQVLWSQQTPGSTTVASNVQINSYCDFYSGGNYNTISGTATLDNNNNGCDTNDIHPTDLKVMITSGATSGASFTNNGNYAFYTGAGTYTLTPQFENPYYTVLPTSATLSFPSLNSSTQTQDFCITANGIHNDVVVYLVCTHQPNPGFDTHFRLIYKNKGNQILSGTVNFTFDDSVLDFISASTSVDAQSINNLNWNYSNLLPFETRTIDIILNVNGPMETPPVNIDDVLQFSASINPISGDETPLDNVFNSTQIVGGSFDPNDKTCLEGNTIPPNKVGDYLHYLIRFQNSGTAPAQNIVVKDIIDTTKFDMSSLQLITTSHPQVTRITGNKVEFIFENIQLPDEQDDEPGSHGFVAFKIRTKSNLVLGNTVSNTADIYFDYNFPIVTNTATTTIAALSANEFENTTVSITPNPVKNDLNISANDVISSIQIYDVQGRLIATQVNNSTSTHLDMSQQNVGVYFVKVITENGVKVEKIIKE